LQSLDQLIAGVASGQVPGNQARSVFDTQILTPFKQQIGGLKTASVRESRLKNQVNDLENIYQTRVPPLIEEQKRRAADQARFAAIDSRLIPQFAIGGISAGGGLAILHPNEMVLTQTHQARIAARAGDNIFESVGVPGVQPSANFDNGGICAGGRPQIVIQNLTIEAAFVTSEEDARRMTRVGLSGQEGEDLLVNNIQVARKRKRI
jgi:hypothetical protein